MKCEWDSIKNELMLICIFYVYLSSTYYDDYAFYKKWILIMNIEWKIINQKVVLSELLNNFYISNCSMWAYFLNLM